MKLPNISFGIALGGTLCVRDILPFYDFLVLWVPNGQNVFCIVVGLNTMFLATHGHGPSNARGRKFSGSDNLVVEIAILEGTSVLTSFGRLGFSTWIAPQDHLVGETSKIFFIFTPKPWGRWIQFD